MKKNELPSQTTRCFAEDPPMSEESLLETVEIRYRSRLQEAAAEVSRLFVTSDETDLDKALKIVGESLRANRAYIFHTRDNGAKMDNTYEWCLPGTAPQIEMLQNLDASAFPWWMTRLERGENIAVTDVNDLPPDAGAEKKILQAQNIQSLLVVPIYSRGELMGFLGVDDTEKTRIWREPDVKMLRVVAEMIAGDMDRTRTRLALRKAHAELEKRVLERTAQLTESEQRMRALSERLQNLIEDERRRVAREIHDELGAALTAIKVSLGLFARNETTSPRKLASSARAAQKLVDGAMDTVQRICGELRPRMLDDLGLADAMDWYAKDTQKRTGIRCYMYFIPHALNVPDEFVTHLFRIYQELVTNAVRHAQADEIMAQLQHADREIILEVGDNGRGITRKQALASNSFGLIGIRERAESLGGTFVIAGRRGKGTKATVTIPIEEGAIGDETADSHSCRR